jgi:quinol monooxygenase YgiN
MWFVGWCTTVALLMSHKKEPRFFAATTAKQGAPNRIEEMPQQGTGLHGGRPSMIVSTSRITVYPEKRGEFLQTVAQLLEPSKGSKGCLAFRLYVDVTDENSSLLLSEWETESDLNDYLHSADFAILHGAITVLSRRSSEFKAIANVVTNTTQEA